MASAAGNLAPSRSTNEEWSTTTVFDIGASGLHTKKFGKGITSVTRQAAGQFTVFFQDVGGALIDILATNITAAGTVQLIGKLNVDSFSSTTKSATVEFWTVTTTPVRADPPSGSDVRYTATWLKSL